MVPMDVLTVIVNYRSAEPDGRLPPVAGGGAGGRAAGLRVVVTDNASPDDSVAQLTAAVAANGWALGSRSNRCRKNGGFAYGNNAAIGPALAAAPRPDLRPAAEPRHARPPRRRRRAGRVPQRRTRRSALAGSRLEDPDGTPQRVGLPLPNGRQRVRPRRAAGRREQAAEAAGRQPAGAAPRPVPCDWVAGASMLVRPAVFDAAG